MKVKKQWIPFLLIYAFAFHLVGATFKGVSAGTIGEAIGYLLFPFIIGFTFIYRSKTQRQVYNSHIGHAVLLIILLFNSYVDARNSMKSDFIAGCERSQMKTNFQLPEADRISLAVINNYCSCMADKLLDDALFRFISKSFFYSEPIAIENDLKFQETIMTVALTCQTEI